MKIPTRIICRSFSNSKFQITGNLNQGIEVGRYLEVSHVFSQEEVSNFAQICGDNNPLHVDPEFAKTTIFKNTIVHGILVSSLFSTLFGRSIHGAIYVNQSLNFKRPVFVGAKVTAKIEILNIDDRSKGKMLTCSTKCFTSEGLVAIDGEAKVLLPHSVSLGH